MNAHPGSSMLTRAGAGLVGATALTAAHQALRATMPDAPRMDVYGERALGGMLKSLGISPPRGRRLYALTLAGDVVSNALFYALLAGRGRAVRGALAGTAAGVGAVLLGPALGLGKRPSRKTRRTTLATVGLYVAGGIVTALAAKVFARARLEFA